MLHLQNAKRRSPPEMLRLRFSPYAYARVAVMRSRLLRQQDYDRLMKMGPQECILFLQDSLYPHLQGYVLSSGLIILEARLNAHLLGNVKKLHQITMGRLQQLIADYALRYDLENMKMILRAIATNCSRQEAEALLYPSFHYSAAFWQKLLQCSTWGEAVASLPFLSPGEGESLFAAENAIDHYYLTHIAGLAAQLCGSGKPVGKLLQQELELINLQILLRLRSQGKDPTPFLVKPSLLVRKMAQRPSMKEMIQLLQAEKYITPPTISTPAHSGQQEEFSQAELELALPASLLRRQLLLMHQSMLSATTIIGYLFAQEIEVRNIKVLIKGKILHLPEQEFERLLVIPS